MAGRHGGSEEGFALTEALGEALGGLDAGPEPPMPDLVSGAIVQGTRIRRRRRIGSALGSAAMAAVVMVCGYGVIAPTQASRPSPPASEPTVWYPSLKLLRTIVPVQVGTVEAAQPQQSRFPATYFRLTDPTTGEVSDLYTLVARSDTGPSLPSDPADCRDGSGAATLWGGHAFKCGFMRLKSQDRVLTYLIEKKSLPARMDKSDSNPFAYGFTYVTTGGLKAQLIVSHHGKHHVDTYMLADLAHRLADLRPEETRR